MTTIIKYLTTRDEYTFADGSRRVPTPLDKAIFVARRVRAAWAALRLW